MEKKGQPNQGTGSANERLQQQNPKNDPQGDTQRRQEGGHGGYSQDEEQQQVNRENEKMHNERDEQDLDTSREEKVQSPQRTTDPGKTGNDDYQRNRE